jgi:hypothetical protein
LIFIEKIRGDKDLDQFLSLSGIRYEFVSRRLLIRSGILRDPTASQYLTQATGFEMQLHLFGILSAFHKPDERLAYTQEI